LVTIKFDYFVFKTISAFLAIQRYFELIESQIGKVKDEEWEKLKELPIPKDDEEYQTEYIPTIGAHKHEFEKLLPRLVSYSFVVMLFSELEFRIKEICKELRKRENIPVKLNEFSGDLVDKFSKFLRKANESQVEKEVKIEIKSFKEIRNCIVHNNGFLGNDKRSDRVRNLAKNELHIKIECDKNTERIIINNAFCYSRIEFFIKMFRGLFEVFGFGPEYPEVSDNKQV
jgi:hypothetical protein